MTSSQQLRERQSGFDKPDVPNFDILNTCVHCGLCLPTCPTYRETFREQSSPRGRLHLMAAVANGRLDVLDPGFVSQMYECLDCRACEAVCPSGVRYGAVLEASRTQVERARERRGRRSPLERLTRSIVFGPLFGDLRLFRAASAAARAYERSGLRALIRRSGVLTPLRLDALESQLPSVSRRFFVPHGEVFRAQSQRRGSVGLLAGCIMHTAFAEIDRATVRVLTRNGWDVAVPAGQGCCGALHVHAGDLDGGRKLMRRNITAFEQADVDFVVNNAAGCGAAMKDYGHLLQDDPQWSARAAALSARVRDVSELLTASPLQGELGPLSLTVTVQDACHLVHAQRISAAPRALLRSIPGLRLVEMPESSLCCGSAGIYSITQPQMSQRLLRRKLEHASATAATVIASTNPGCMLQLRAGLQRQGRRDLQVAHVIELLDRSYAAASAARPTGNPASCSVAG